MTNRSMKDKRPIAPRGFTLMELLVGLTIGVLVLFGLVTLFVNSSRTRREVDQTSQQIENGRYALDVLRDELHLAGYYGGLVPYQGYPIASATTPSVCASDVAGLQFVAPPAALQWPVHVFGIAGGDPTPACVAAAPGGVKPGTDILVVRRTSTVAIAGAPAAGNVYVQPSNCKSELVQHMDFAVDVGANAGAFTRTKRGCTTAADIYEFQTRIYYVSNETIPTLRLLTISGTTSTNEAMVQGIDDMRVEFGVDNMGSDGAADAFRKCLSTSDPCAATDWANTMAVRLYLLARNLAPEGAYTDTKTYALGTGVVAGPFNDHYKRHAYAAVVRLMNPAGRREL
jgi:type IV pilus assembly protein PilW